MSSIAEATLMGNLTRDPESNEKVDGLIHLSIACNKKIKDKESVTFFDVDCWGEAGEFVKKFYSKGDPIYCKAEISSDHWEDNDGKKRTKMKFKLIPYSTVFLPKGKQVQSSGEEF
jgi:single-strand DNA-binding protein